MPEENNLKCIVRAAMEELCNQSSILSKSWPEGNRRCRKINKHEICDYSHNLREENPTK